MLISEMIATLSELKERHGDLPVVKENGSYIEDVKSLRALNSARHLKQSLSKPMEMIILL